MDRQHDNAFLSAGRMPSREASLARSMSSIFEKGRETYKTAYLILK